MQSKLVAESAGVQTFVLILDQGEEAFSTVSDFAGRERLGAASLTALGAFSEATVGWFDLAGKTDRKIPVAHQCEVLSARSATSPRMIAATRACTFTSCSV
jgi:hypothetical protein